MTALVAVFALLSMGSAHGAALKAQSTVTADIITVGDVFDDTGPFAGRYLAPAPAPGGVTTLNAGDLARISAAFNLGWEPASGGETLAIARAGGIDRYAIEAALQERIAAEMPGRRFEMEMAEANPFIPAEGAVTVEKLRIDTQKGAFTATLSAPGARKNISGRILSLAQVPVLKNPLRKGDLITAGDIEYVDMPAQDVSVSTIVDAEKLIGQTPRRGLAAMKPVAGADIETPPMIRKGETVTVALQNGTLGLSMQARALETGAAGDIVRIVNTASNRTIEGIVTGPGAVTIRLPSAL